MTKAYTITSLTHRGGTLYWDGEEFTHDGDFALVFTDKEDAFNELMDLDRMGHDVEINIHFMIGKSVH